MSKSYKIKGVPAKWVSAHRENIFKYRLPQSTIYSIINNGSGKMRITTTGAFSGFTPLVGERIFIPKSGSDFGYYATIETMLGPNQFDINLAWTANFGGSIPIWLVRLPEVQLYSGWRAGELVLPVIGGTVDMYTMQPYTLIGKFFPESGTDGYVRFDVSGYLKVALPSPYKMLQNPDEAPFVFPFNATQLYPTKQYTRVQVVIEYTLEYTMFVANASISTNELNQKFVDTMRVMQPLEQPIRFDSDGPNIADTITGNFLIKTIN
jgi:hypothetical protein